MFRRAAAKQQGERALENAAGFGEKEMPEDLERTVAAAWKPDCRGLRSEWVERKWRQRV